MRAAALSLGKRGGAGTFRSPTLYPAELWAHTPRDAKSTTIGPVGSTPRHESPKGSCPVGRTSDFYSAALYRPSPASVVHTAFGEQTPAVPHADPRSPGPTDCLEYGPAAGPQSDSPKPAFSSRDIAGGKKEVSHG